MKTLIYINSADEHQFVSELEESFKDFSRKHPGASSGYFTHDCVGWKLTANGYCLEIDHMIVKLPLILSGVPIYMVRLEDTIEDPKDIKPVRLGLHRARGVRGQVDSFFGGDPGFWRYTVNVEGKHLAAVNRLFNGIRKGAEPVDGSWDPAKRTP